MRKAKSSSRSSSRDRWLAAVSSQPLRTFLTSSMNCHKFIKASILIFGLAVSPGIALSQPKDYYGTAEPFASEAIYQILTDRFVDGDPSNNHQDQGGARPTWERKLDGPNGAVAYVGYTGGDFKGIYDNADYITSMGFTAVSISPIVDNPDEAFVTTDAGFTVHYGAPVGVDGGKAGYHGYWGVNFYKVDEHLESPGMSFREFAAKVQSEHGLKIVLDIVCNHGSPAWSMPVDQPKFGELYDENGRLIADHQNKESSQLDPVHEPLHRFYNNRGSNPPGVWDETKNLVRLSDLNENNPEVVDYLANAYLKWIDQGVDAFRVDTIAWMPHAFWKRFSDKIRAKHPNFFMYAENFNFDPMRIAEHQKPENGAISVLDFPGRGAITNVFESANSNYADILGYLHLTDRTYTNPYELAIFYDNHDVNRMNASDEGFIDANNWLFTSRGIPVVYYGSEIGFMRGRLEHSGNRNPFGAERIAQAKTNKTRQALAKVGQLRKRLPSLQRGIQINLDFAGHIATFFRVYQKGDTAQTALVLLNKGHQAETITVNRLLSTGKWVDADSGETTTIGGDTTSLSKSVPSHGVEILIFDGAVNHPELLQLLDDQMTALAPSHQLRN